MSYLLGISRLIQLILKLHKTSRLKSAFFYLIAQILVPPKDLSPIGSLEALYIYIYICIFFFYVWFLLHIIYGFFFFSYVSVSSWTFMDSIVLNHC